MYMLAQSCTDVHVQVSVCISKVVDQRGISQTCYVVEMYHSGRELSICSLQIYFVSRCVYAANTCVTGVLRNV